MKRIKKKIAIALSATVIFSSFSGFTYYDGIGNVYYDSKKEIFEGATYREQIAVHNSNGNEKAYFVEADMSDKIEAIVLNGEVRKSYTLDSFVKSAEQQGYKVLAAINGDLYDTSTGTPKGLVIHDGKIVTSGYEPDRVIAIDGDGKASMQYVKLNYTVKGITSTVVQVENPEYKEYLENVSNSAITNESSEQTSNTESSETNQDMNTNTETLTENIPPATIDQVVEKNFSSNIGFVNVPHGGANALHLFNRNYASTTKTSGNCVEIVIDCGSAQNTELTVGGTIKGTVVSVNENTNNTPIGANQVVLSTVANSYTAPTVKNIKVGSTIEISVTDNANTGLEQAKEAIGFFYSLLEEGKVVTSGNGLNPRTAVGIKEDGSLVVYAVDGRQNSSKGLSLLQLADHMKALGCTYAFNMDGGGSTTLYSRLPGKEASATIKNVPSNTGAAQRKVANALLLVYKGTGSNEVHNLSVYPSMTLAMPGASVQLSTYASNELFEPVTLSNSVQYYVKEGSGTVNSTGLYTAGQNIGVEVIEATSGKANGQTQIEVIKDDLIFTPSTKKVTLEANQTTDINMSVKRGPVDVVSSDKLFIWSCDEHIGTIDANGIFKASEKTAQTGNIYVQYRTYNLTIPVQIGSLSIDFADTMEHWARTYIGSLAARGIVNGMGDNLYKPDASLTRAQFLVLLAKTLEGVDVTKSAPAGFTDVPENEWYYDYVNWGYANGIVNGMGDGLFKPNDNITREQMCVMLCNFASSQNFALPQLIEVKPFTDQTSISPWAIDYVVTVAGSEIINGMPEGDFQPQKVANRAQAAKVVYSYLELFN